MIPQAVSAELALQPLLQNADHVDVKTFSSDVSMRTFIAGLISYHPVWLKGLYAIRWGFVRLLGMQQKGLPPTTQMPAG